MLSLALDAYSALVLLAVVLSWFPVSPDNPLRKVTDTMVEPILSQIRKILPAMGGFDLSPIVLILGIRVLRRFLL